MNERVSRAFLYGESVFSTMKMVDGLVMHWDYHFDRLRKGVEFLYGPFTEADWKLTLKNHLENRLEQETGDKIIRLTIHREQHERGLRSLHHLSVHDLKFHVSVSLFEATDGKGVSLRTAPAIPRPGWWPSYLKAGNYLETIISQRKHLQSHDDDLLFLSHADTLLETSIANIFTVRHHKLYTAPAGPNVLEGVTRRKVLEEGKSFFSECLEVESTLEQALKADVVFCSNSVKGLFLVNRIDDYEIKCTPEALEKFEMLRKKISL